MKWFEHQADSSENKKIRRIEIWGAALNAEFGAMAATGWYWRLLEKVATHGVMFRLPQDYGLDLLAADLRTTIEQTTSFLNFLAEINAIDKTVWGKKKLIFCPKLAERADRYTEDLIKKEVNEHEGSGEPITITYELYEVIRALSEHVDPRKRTYYRNTLNRFCAEDVQRMCRVFPSQDHTTPHHTKQVGSAPPNPPPGGNGGAHPSVYSCKHFEITQEFYDKLLLEYPGMTPTLLISEISKAHDWLEDNPDRHKRRANGHLKNPRSFLKNWLSRVVVGPGAREGPGASSQPGLAKWLENKRRQDTP